MNRPWDLWRYLGAAIAAALLAASQLNPNPVPVWVFPVVGGLTLLSAVWMYLLARRRR